LCAAIHPAERGSRRLRLNPCRQGRSGFTLAAWKHITRRAGRTALTGSFDLFCPSHTPTTGCPAASSGDSPQWRDGSADCDQRDAAGGASQISIWPLWRAPRAGALRASSKKNDVPNGRESCSRTGWTGADSVHPSVRERETKREEIPFRIICARLWPPRRPNTRSFVRPFLQGASRRTIFRSTPYLPLIIRYLRPAAMRTMQLRLVEVRRPGHWSR